MAGSLRRHIETTRLRRIARLSRKLQNCRIYRKAHRHVIGDDSEECLVYVPFLKINYEKSLPLSAGVALKFLRCIVWGRPSAKYRGRKVSRVSPYCRALQVYRIA